MTDGLARTCASCGEPFPDEGETCPACGGKPRPVREDPFLLAEAGTDKAKRPEPPPAPTAAAPPPPPEPVAPPPDRVVHVPVDEKPAEEPAPPEPEPEEAKQEEPSGDTVRMSLADATKAWLEDSPVDEADVPAPEVVPSSAKTLLIVLGVAVVVLALILALV